MGDYKPGDVVWTEFVTNRFDTGAATVADSLPTGTINKNGTDDGAVTVTVTSLTGGRYKATFTIPTTYIVGDVVVLTIAATVNSVAGIGKVWEGRVDVGFIAAGTATAGGAATITLQTGLGADHDGEGCLIVLTSGTGAGQAGVITGYVESTKVVTVGRNWVTNPTNTTTYAIIAADLPKVDSNHKISGVVLADTVTTLTNLPSIPANWLTAAGTASDFGAEMATAIWTDIVAGDFTVAASIGKSIMNGVSLGTGLTVARCTLVDTVTTVTNQLTAAAIAAGVWRDNVAGDFTVAASIGKSVMNGVALGTGLTINAYTGDTPQTGDALANGASGFVAIKGDTAAIKTQTDKLGTGAALVTLADAVVHGGTTAKIRLGTSDSTIPFLVTSDQSNIPCVELTSSLGTGGYAFLRIVRAGHSVTGDSGVVVTTSSGNNNAFATMDIASTTEANGAVGLSTIASDAAGNEDWEFYLANGNLLNGSTGSMILTHFDGASVIGGGIAAGPVVFTGALSVSGTTTLVGAVTAANAGNDINIGTTHGVLLADGVAHGGTPGGSTATLALKQMQIVAQDTNTTAVIWTGLGSGSGLISTAGATGYGGQFVSSGSATAGLVLSSSGLGGAQGLAIGSANAGGIALSIHGTGKDISLLGTTGITVAGTTTLSGAVSLGSTLGVTGTTTIGNLAVTGTTTLTGIVTANDPSNNINIGTTFGVKMANAVAHGGSTATLQLGNSSGSVAPLLISNGNAAGPSVSLLTGGVPSVSVGLNGFGITFLGASGAPDVYLAGTGGLYLAGTTTLTGAVTASSDSNAINLGAAGMAKFFTLDSTKLFADAVAGSVVKETANGAGGSSPAVIAAAVWDEARAGHVAAGSFGEYTLARLADNVAHGGASLSITGAVTFGDTWTVAGAVAWNAGATITSSTGIGVSISSTVAEGVVVQGGADVDQGYDAVSFFGGITADKPAGSGLGIYTGGAGESSAIALNVSSGNSNGSIAALFSGQNQSLTICDRPNIAVLRAESVNEIFTICDELNNAGVFIDGTDRGVWINAGGMGAQNYSVTLADFSQKHGISVGFSDPAGIAAIAVNGPLTVSGPTSLISTDPTVASLTIRGALGGPNVDGGLAIAIYGGNGGSLFPLSPGSGAAAILVSGGKGLSSGALAPSAIFQDADGTTLIRLTDGIDDFSCAGSGTIVADLVGNVIGAGDSAGPSGLPFAAGGVLLPPNGVDLIMPIPSGANAMNLRQAVAMMAGEMMGTTSGAGTLTETIHSLAVGAPVQRVGTLAAGQNGEFDRTAVALTIPS